jgi:DNA-binding NarL/FixJ family response regulator
VDCKILVVDDHEIVRKGVCRLIAESQPQWEICGEASNGTDAIEAVKALKPDIVVMDITMPYMTGIEATSRINKLELGSRVLLFTVHESESLKLEAQRAGAKGYLLKSQAAPYLIAAIERLLAGETFFGNPSGLGVQARTDFAQ